jgi:hypothetical protein
MSKGWVVLFLSVHTEYKMSWSEMEMETTSRPPWTWTGHLSPSFEVVVGFASGPSKGPELHQKLPT